MSATLIGAVTLMYLWTAFSLYQSGRPEMAITFVGYSLANVGLILDTLRYAGNP